MFPADMIRLFTTSLILLIATGCSDADFSSPSKENQAADATTKAAPATQDALPQDSTADTETKTDQNNENEIVFGGNDQVFHIGDGVFVDSSSCASSVRELELKGSTYYFEFEVTNESTSVDITINQICGIDYVNNNYVYLRGAKDSFYSAALTRSSTHTIPSKILAAGSYTIVVESRQAGLLNRSSPNDHDDFIVGNVKIKASAPVKAIRVGAE